MYRIYNAAFDLLNKQYNISSLDEADNDLLARIADENGIGGVPKYNEDKRVFYGFDRDLTIQKIEKYFTFSTYMGDGYWEERHMKKAEESDISPKLAKMKSGDDVFEIMARHKLGFSKLKPGNTSDVDWTTRYLEDVFSKTPMQKFVQITDLNTGKIYGKEEPVEAAKAQTTLESMAVSLDKALEAAEASVMKASNIDYKTMQYQELVKIAREKGIDKPNFKTKDMLVTLLNQ